MRIRLFSDRDDPFGGQPSTGRGYLDVEALPAVGMELLLGSPPKPFPVVRVIVLPQPQHDRAAATVVVKG